MTDKTEAQPEALPDLDIDTAGHSGIRIRGYSVDRVKSLHAEIQQLKAQLTSQTNRAAAAEQQVTALTQRLDMANRLNTDARDQLAQLSARQAAPDGWSLAPVKPTPEMINAGVAARRSGGTSDEVYMAMLSAAPPPPEREPLTVARIDDIGDATGKPSKTWHYEFARAIERAHGIGATND